MERFLKIGLGALCILVFLGACLLLLPHVLFKDLCGEEITSEIISPDGRYVAAVFVRNCGATTSYATHVNLRRFTGTFRTNWSGTITDGEVFVTHSGPGFPILWENSSRLIISCRGCQREDGVFKQEKSWGNVGIAYRFD